MRENGNIMEESLLVSEFFSEIDRKKWYISKVVTEAVNTYVKKKALDYEIDWSAFEPDY